MSNLTALVVASGLLLQASLVSSAVLRHSDAVAARVDERSNPLLQEGELPPFALVKDEHAKPAVESRLSGRKTKLADLEASLKKKLMSGQIHYCRKASCNNGF